MENTALNWILVSSFGFVSVSLGVKWIGEILIDYLMAKQGVQVMRVTPNDLEKIMKEGEEDDDSTDRR